jgi:hypothetical protein
MWWWICKEGKMFDAAIQILRNWVIFGQGENKQSAEAAIRVLEAAGKVDKRQAAGDRVALSPVPCADSRPARRAEGKGVNK